MDAYEDVETGEQRSYERPKSQADWSRANERKRIAAGGRRMPGGVLPSDAAEALAALQRDGYAPSATGCIVRALIEATKKPNR